MPTTTESVTLLDVRSILADGGEPLDLILSMAASIAIGNALDLIAPFDPRPLYPVLQLRGFRAWKTPEDGGATRVRFTQTGIVSATTLAEAAARGSATAAVLGRHGMDACCSGPKTLEFAARAHGIELSVLLGELQGVA